MPTQTTAKTAAPAPAPVAAAAPVKTQAELAAEKAAKENQAKLEVAHEKAGKANANLVKDGSPHQIQPQIRDGEVRYQFGNFVPTRFLTGEETEALEGMKKA